MRAAGKRLVGARFGAVIAAAVVFLVGLGWLVLPQQAPSTAVPQTPQAQRQADGARQNHAQPQAQMPPHSDRDAAPEQHQAARDARRDGNADAVAWWSAVVTTASAVVQAVSAAFTLAATVALVFISRAQRDISAGQKTISEEQRSISANQAEIMAGQRDIAREQTAILREQASTTRILADVERPVLLVRRVDPMEFQHMGTIEPGGAGRYRPWTLIHFANYGRTPGVLLAVEGTIVPSKHPPPAPAPDYHIGMSRLTDSRVIEAGTENGASAEITGDFVTEGNVPFISIGPGAFFVYGRLIYRDSFGARAETGFGYVLHFGAPGVCVPFAAYNYRKTYDADDKNAPHIQYEQ